MLARWESLRGKYWVELHRQGDDYVYKGDGCGGYLGNKLTDTLALLAMILKLDDMFPGQYRRVA